MLPNFIKVITLFWYSFKSVILIIRWEKSIQILIILPVLLIISSVIFKGPLFEIVARKLGMFMLVVAGANIIFKVVINEVIDVVIEEQINKKLKGIVWIIIALMAMIVGIYMFRFLK